MHIACWITKATNTHSEHVIFISFPLRQQLHERALVLHYTLLYTIIHLCTLPPPLKKTTIDKLNIVGIRINKNDTMINCSYANSKINHTVDGIL